ncbi:MAG: R3H domain-containing nucleic acid-binding protein [Cyanobacteria bacterium J06634_6]
MEKSISWLEKLLTLQGLDASVSGNQTTGDLGDDSYWLTIDTANLSAEEIETLIGNRGDVLDSIQYLANTILNMKVEKAEQHSYTIEINGYRKKRQAELKALAEEAAAEVLNNGQSEHEIKGLSSAERRQVHGLMSEYPQIETFSRGREPERHLVVKVVDAKVDDADSEDAGSEDAGSEDGGSEE